MRIGTRYAKQLVEDVAWSKQWVKKVGLGFKLMDLQLETGQHSGTKNTARKSDVLLGPMRPDS